jgi:hypothetical protein
LESNISKDLSMYCVSITFSHLPTRCLCTNGLGIVVADPYNEDRAENHIRVLMHAYRRDASSVCATAPSTPTHLSADLIKIPHVMDPQKGLDSEVSTGSLQAQDWCSLSDSLALFVLKAVRPRSEGDSASDWLLSEKPPYLS